MPEFIPEYFATESGHSFLQKFP
jgi:hypothetical protein